MIQQLGCYCTCSLQHTTAIRIGLEDLEDLLDIYPGCLLGSKALYKTRTHCTATVVQSAITNVHFAWRFHDTHEKGKISKISHLVLHFRLIHTSFFPHKFDRQLVILLFNTMPANSLSMHSFFLRTNKPNSLVYHPNYVFKSSSHSCYGPPYYFQLLAQ